jgi:hypothetical protein
MELFAVALINTRMVGAGMAPSDQHHEPYAIEALRKRSGLLSCGTIVLLMFLVGYFVSAALWWTADHSVRFDSYTLMR